MLVAWRHRERANPLIQKFDPYVDLAWCCDLSRFYTFRFIWLWKVLGSRSTDTTGRWLSKKPTHRNVSVFVC